MKANMKKIFSAAMCMLLVLATLAGCGSTANQTESTSTAAVEQTTAQTTVAEKPIVELSMMQFDISVDDVEGMKNDRIKKFIEEKFRIKLKIVNPGDTATYHEKLNLYLSSGEAPDIIDDGLEPNFTTNAQKEELLYDMGAAVARNPELYPVLNKLFADPMYKLTNQFKFGDSEKTFAIWSISQLVNPWAGGVVYNGKIVKELGLKLPTTVDEYVAMLREIKAKKPDVIPLGMRVDKGNLIGLLSPLFFRTYGVDILELTHDGKGSFTDTSTSDAAKQQWKLLQTLYKEGIIDKQVITNDTVAVVREKFINGKYATFVSNGPGYHGLAVGDLYNELIKVNPSAKIGVDIMADEAPLKGPAGVANLRLPIADVAATNTVIYGNSKYPDRALELLNYMLSNEGQDLKWFGIEGVHYTKNSDGTKKINRDEFFKDAQVYLPGETTRFEWTPFSDLTGQCYYQFESYPTIAEAANNTRNLIMESYLPAGEIGEYCNKVGIPFEDAVDLMPLYEFLSTGAMSDEQKAIKAKVEDLKKKYYAAFLVGQKDVDKEWVNFVTEVKAAGCDDYAKAFTEAVAKNKAIYDKFVK